MLPRSEREIFRATEQKKRFDADSVRWILGRAAAEHYRLDNELADTYSLEELEEMATEAGISHEALRAAIKSPPGWIAVLQRWMPESWSPTAKGIVLTSVAGIALLAVLLAFPEVAYVLFWTTIVLLVLILLGASPF